MRKLLFCLSCALLVVACDKHDPILPGDRTAVFASSSPRLLNSDVPNLPDEFTPRDNAPCPYTQGTDNVIRDGDRKIFSGFSAPNFVKSDQKPVCSGNFVYAGLTTGELVKVNAKTRAISWIADIYSPSNMTGGASVVDIVAPLVLTDKYVYVGGLGDAFCKVNAATGTKEWCDKISVGVPFIVMDNVAFVVSTDNYLNAVRTSDGAIYWRTPVKKQLAPVYSSGIISIGRQQFNATNGN